MAARSRRAPATPMNARDLARRAARPLRGLRRRWWPRPLDRILDVPGWTQAVQLRYLMRQARSLADGSLIVELGVWHGRSAFAMAEACRGTATRVYAIDPWQDYDEGGGPVAGLLEAGGHGGIEEAYRSFLRYRRELGLAEKVVVVRATSLATAAGWTDGPVALLFIDANHHYDAVTADLEAWVPRVRPGGRVVGDDWNWESVRRAVGDFVARHPGCAVELPCANTWTFVTPS